MMRYFNIDPSPSMGGDYYCVERGTKAMIREVLSRTIDKQYSQYCYETLKITRIENSVIVSVEIREVFHQMWQMWQKLTEL